MEKITRLLFSKVTSEDGRYLGRLVELRSDGPPDHGILNENRVVNELVISGGSFGSQKTVIPWSSVKKFTRNNIIVKDERE
jgi:sporulation protein YlmC with PRC-barrel domain